MISLIWFALSCNINKKNWAISILLEFIEIIVCEIMFRGCLDSFFWSLNFHHSSLITHNSSLITHHLKIPCLFGTITHFPSLNIFHTICGPHTCHRCSFFIFFFQYPNSLNPVEKKKKDRTSENKKRKEKKKRTA